MEQPITSETPSSLCYIDAGHVHSPLGELRGFDVLDAGGCNLGSLVGIVADLPARRVCYWVLAPAAAWEAVDTSSFPSARLGWKRISMLYGWSPTGPDWVGVGNSIPKRSPTSLTNTSSPRCSPRLASVRLHDGGSGGWADHAAGGTGASI